MRSIQSKKGMTINDMYPAVLAILMIGMVLGVGIYILATFHDTVAISYTGSQANINVSTGTTVLINAALAEFAITDTPILTVENATASTFTNFTCTAAGTCTWGSDIIAVDTAGDLLNLTYTYDYDKADTPEEAITTTITGVATFADWIAIIVVVLAAAIVLGVVLSSFGRKRNMI